MENEMSNDGDPSTLENLSALTDGEIDSAVAAAVCAAWRDDPRARSSWHAYQLIGDVLRSDDLACAARHDAAFLAALRQRLADEPTVLAPEPPIEQPSPAATPGVRVAANAGRNGRWAWMAPSAVAAGFVLVAGAVMVTRGPLTGGGQPDGTVVASGNGVAPGGAPTLVPTDTVFVPRAVGGNGKLIRDARLERYLAAHQQFAGTSALGVPSGFLRNAVAEAPNR
ncbi:MAG TPA: sigma-E factor negative regulatory protein [Albitalea sp.]|uniref:sigma-E factor negative regulatory protein n=1 Tax=Piscinibacter sp. TaxID=1903157 RepID=UPI002ED4979F